MSATARSATQQPSAFEHSFAAQLDRIGARMAGVTIICGFPASGKSSAARYLARHADAVILDKDAFAPALEESVMTELIGNPYDRDSETYMRVVNPHIYSALVTEALTIGQRIPVLVDAPFIGYIRTAAEKQISLADYVKSVSNFSPPSVQTVWVSAVPDRIRERMESRGAARDASKLADWATYKADVLDSGIEDSAKAVVDYVVYNS
ncbi:AAA family ATPase [Nocardia sp. CS682]|uniref:AAA family ATPase n=1 Tax=Nocardia sp. CS682 TaxID=1047172 RepID=UPI0010753EF6|nr:AAA family ATPase [Nocardia sp. CS682]QBS40409.1 hypothetical protein DMB37_10055 [Nocardia sp. CS682]